MVGSSQKSRNCDQTTMKDAQLITCQSSNICTRGPDAWTTIHQQETMTQYPHAVADHGRRQHRTATDLRDLIRPTLPCHHLGSRVVNKCTVLDSQPTSSVPRRVRLAIERNIDEMCPKRNPLSRTQYENLDVKSVGTTRPWRGVALFEETCNLTDEEAQEATVSSVSQCESWNNHPWHPPNSLEKSLRILHDVVFSATRTRCPLHHDPDRFRGCTFRGTVFGA